jgi:carbon storage regulator CsrA
MLALSRKKGERIAIDCPDGTRLWLVVADVDRNKVRIGIQAPADYLIRREEIIPVDEASQS